MKFLKTVMLVMFGILGAKEAMAQSLSLSFSTPASQYINKSNQASLGLAGSCSEPNAQIAVKLGSYGTVYSVCSVGKTWSITNINAVNWLEGAVDIEAYFKTSPANSVKRSFIKDTYTPFVTLDEPANGSVFLPSNIADVKVLGMCEEGKLDVTFTDVTGKKLSVTPVCDLMQYLYSAPFDLSSLSDGQIDLVVTNTSPSGNAGVASSTYLKSTAPTTVTLTSMYKAINIANAAIHSFGGACNSEGGKVFLDIFSSVNAVTPVQTLLSTCYKSAWSIPNVSLASATLPDGTMMFRARFMNLTTKQWALPPTLNLLKMTTPVEVKIASPSNGYIMNKALGAKLTVKGSCSINNQVVNIGYLKPTGELVTLISPVCKAGAYSAVAAFGSLADGVIALSVQQSDAAGNIGRQDLSFSKKLSLPKVTLAASALKVNISNVAVMSLSGTCSEWGDLGKQVTVETAPALPGQPLFAICQAPKSGTGKGTWSLPNLSLTVLPDGSFTATAKHTDFAGNVATARLSLVKDTLQPTLMITKPALENGQKFIVNAANASAPIEIAGSCNKPGATIVASGVGAAITTTCSYVNTWSVMLNFAAVADGKSLIENFKITDSVGNVAVQSLGFDKKTTLPSITITAPLANSFINIANVNVMKVAGACSEFGNLGMPVYIKLGAIEQQAVCNAGSYLVQMSATALADGTLPLTVSQIDYIGNKASISYNLIKKTLAPTLTLTSPGLNYVIDDKNMAAIPFGGKCSENGLPVAMTGSLSGSVNCVNGAWALQANASALANGTLNFRFSHKDLAGNEAVQTIGLQKMAIGCDVTIASAADFSKATSLKAKKVCLANDIQLSESNQPKPINLENGEFDGRGFMIRGFIHGTNGGLFDKVTNGKLSNLILDSVVIKARSYVGVGLLVNQFSGQMENVRVQNISMPVPLAPIKYSTCGLVVNVARDAVFKCVSVDFGSLRDLDCGTFGAVVASAYDANFINIHVKGSYVGKAQYLGGLAGSLSWKGIETPLLISGVQVAMNADLAVSGDTYAYLVGGFFGSIHHFTRYKVVDSSFAGSLNGLYVGGITGSGGGAEEFRNVSVRATLSKGGYLGGLIGAASTSLKGGNTVVDSSEVIVNMAEVGSGNSAHAGGISSAISKPTSVTNSKLDVTASSPSRVLYGVGIFGSSSGIYVGSGANVRMVEALIESGNDYRGLFSSVYAPGGQPKKYELCFDACYGANGILSFDSQTNNLMINGMPRTPVAPKISGFLAAPVKVGKDLLVSGAITESNMAGNLAGVLISMGTSAADRRVLGFVDNKTPSDGKFEFMISESILLNCNGIWDCSKMRVFAEGIDRTGKVTELAAQTSTGLGN